ncbi:SAM-dependent methyltransferase [Catenulispora sp. NF23]|uniref:SAM-dependent methyltransferase n=1 Tax=Catenulispora pinistramenti TaxID=2705254 RepID=A0ABS5L5A1_9ACTN|nr:SAM-dependent methyltransferase [Catenulispora pinistramenti]MBS2537846.1 SAM-dependent methyltransferase [Catenulispora pinistramenti]MBS2553516.1 SAM-dependent methyltransferase [Catenulispora pinistramenti]
MTADSESPEIPRLPRIDTTVPQSARVWNYWLGGKDHYAVDREAGDQFAAVYPGIFDLARLSRYFLGRVIRHLAGEAGVRQFLDVGTGLPTADNTHEVAQRVNPEARIVYVDNDPLILAHANALLVGDPRGATAYIEADLLDPDTIIAEARKTLDFDEPVALLLMQILGHVSNADDDAQARSVINRLMDALPAGSYLVISESSNTNELNARACALYNESGGAPYYLRDPEQIADLFAGLELTEPGVVPIHEWRPDPNPFGQPADEGAWGGAGRKV